MEITNQTDVLLVVKCRARYAAILLAIPMLAFSVLLLVTKAYGASVFILLVGALVLLFVNRWRLTVDKQANVVVVERKNMLGLLNSKKTLLLSDVANIRYQNNLNTKGFGSTVTILINRKDGKPLIFGATKPHYIAGAIKGNWTMDSRNREQDIALQIAQFIGVECAGIPQVNTTSSVGS